MVSILRIIHGEIAYGPYDMTSHIYVNPHKNQAEPCTILYAPSGAMLILYKGDLSHHILSRYTQ